ncbi:MAG: thiamine pyrophosphate-dependent enzyme [Anaerolineaceae bacterium]|nr:thiamine pyrophosphate-dependent enzyme [Anaerolineaceae bacterium]
MTPVLHHYSGIIIYVECIDRCDRGFLDEIMRCTIGDWIKSVGFPYGTLVVNLLGCLLIGWLSRLADSRDLFNPEVRLLVFIGLLGARTTTPSGKDVLRKDMLAIAEAHHIPYAASASPGYINDLRKKVKKGSQIPGPAYIHVHTPYPTGWSFDPSRSIEVAQAAVQSGAWPLYEVEGGKRRLTVKTAKLKPVGGYLKLQGRFDHLSQSEIDEIQRQVEQNFKRLEGEC